MTLPLFTMEMRVDDWWNTVRQTEKYPVLCKVVLALLSPFHGPQVESAFNVMGDILHVKSASTSVQTYESYQAVKYHLRTAKKSAIEFFSRKDQKRSPVNHALCRNMKLASNRYRGLLKQRKEQQEERRRKFLLKKKKETKKDVNKAMEIKMAKSREEFKIRKQKRLLALKAMAEAKRYKKK